MLVIYTTESQATNETTTSEICLEILEGHVLCLAVFPLVDILMILISSQ